MDPFQDLGAITVYEDSIYLNGEAYTSDFRDLLKFPDPMAHLMLSGGCDSQAMASWLMYLGVPIRAYTYAALWGDEVINAADVVQAQRYAQRHSLDHRVIDFDLREFYRSHEYVEVAKRYQCRSPQVAVHLKFMEQLGTDNLVTGGESTLLAGTNFNRPSTYGLSTNLFLNYHRVYKQFGDVNGVDVHRNWFWSDPKIFWAAMRANIDVAFDGYNYIPVKMKKEEIAYKNRLYQAQGFDIMPLGAKHTGFEQLKKILACETGVYDEYDKRYREPLRKLIPPPDWDIKRITISDDFRELLDEYIKVASENAHENLALYRYDF